MAIDLNKSSTLLDDAVDGRQSEAGAFAGWLRGEERLKNVRLCLRGHPDACVTDSQLDIPTRHHRRIPVSQSSSPVRRRAVRSSAFSPSKVVGRPVASFDAEFAVIEFTDRLGRLLSSLWT